ncbi:molybdopterin-dependent oxidoreductase [Cellulomonas sp. P22]|uniref:molybdopterin-dependent oxidoreductase n=1 Tax=Cellulomonas sp. P22 TaxID=3373189 RepID=UPI0037A8E0DD
MNRTVSASLAGVASGALTLGVASLAAAVVSPLSDPLLALGGAFVDATPRWLKDAAVQLFGTNDKRALTVGTVLVVAALAALAGVLAERWWALGAGLVVVLGGVAAVAAATRPDAGALAPLPSLLGAGAGLVALRLLLNRLDTSDAPTTPDPADEPTALPPAAGRRTFLLAAGAVTVVGVVGAVGGRVLGASRRAVDAARDALRLPTPTRTVSVPAGAGAALDGTAVGGLDPWVTPNADFYRIDTALAVPQVDPAAWSLRVHGLVEREVTLTFDELLADDLVEAWVTLACVSNEVGGDLVGNARWLGLPLRTLLARAVPRDGADMVLSTSADGFTASTPLEVLTDDRDALLAVGMNGEPLPFVHGFPVRMVVPGLYGYVSATKWVVDLEVTRFADATAYWTDRGWSPRGPVKTQSRIEVPRAGASVDAGRVVVAGTSWAQHRGVVGVEVRVDDGPWHQATLAADGGIDTWRQWAYAWDAEPGRHTLQVRAADPDGPQTGKVTGTVPDGATGYDTVTVDVS